MVIPEGASPFAVKQPFARGVAHLGLQDAASEAQAVLKEAVYQLLLACQKPILFPVTQLRERLVEEAQHFLEASRSDAARLEVLHQDVNLKRRKHAGAKTGDSLGLWLTQGPQ